jgi:hypothetical protein
MKLLRGKGWSGRMAFITGKKVRESERRTSERRRVSVGSWIISMDAAMVLACQTFDASARGVRVQPNQTQLLPKTVFYLDMKDRIAYEAAVRWQNKTEAGLEFTKAWRFADLPEASMKQLVQTLSS